jgi:hypothetical protein
VQGQLGQERYAFGVLHLLLTLSDKPTAQYSIMRFESFACSRLHVQADAAPSAQDDESSPEVEKPEMEGLEEWKRDFEQEDDRWDIDTMDSDDVDDDDEAGRLIAEDTKKEAAARSDGEDEEDAAEEEDAMLLHGAPAGQEKLDFRAYSVQLRQFAQSLQDSSLVARKTGAEQHRSRRADAESIYNLATSSNFFPRAALAFEASSASDEFLVCSESEVLIAAIAAFRSHSSDFFRVQCSFSTPSFSTTNAAAFTTPLAKQVNRIAGEGTPTCTVELGGIVTRLSISTTSSAMLRDILQQLGRMAELVVGLRHVANAIIEQSDAGTIQVGWVIETLLGEVGKSLAAFDSVLKAWEQEIADAATTMTTPAPSLTQFVQAMSHHQPLLQEQFALLHIVWRRRMLCRR